MYHRMYLRRCSMSSISEESETGDDDHHLDEEFIICNNQEENQTSTNLSVENCLGDLSSFKEEIREAYEELTSLEREARNKRSTSPTIFNIEQEDDLDILLEQLHTLEQRLDQTKMFRNESIHRNKKSISPTIIAQFDQLDQALATLTNTLNNVEIELVDSGNSSSSSAVSDSTTIHHHHQTKDDKHNENEGDEHFSDSGLSQSTDSISLPFKQQSQIRTNSQISNASSVLSCDTLKNPSEKNHIRVALEKLHEANIKKMFIKIHNEDKSTKNILIDETMSIYDIIILLLHKYHLQPTYNYSIIEDLPDLHIYRIFEDHQNLINDAVIYWSRDTHNRICFQQNPMKYSIFNEGKKFFSAQDKILNDNNILNDYISSNTIILPDDITSTLYIKDKNRKIWKKYSCILRQSGIYQIPKSSSTKRDLICLLKFDINMQLYYANNWIEHLRSPTQYGFALKYAHIQKKSNKYIHYLCTNTSDECQRWINGIRIIQYGIQLYKNYQQIKKVIDNGFENLSKILPNQHYFNFIQSNTSSIMSESISLPINQILSDTSKSFNDLQYTTIKKNFNSLDRQNKSKINFIRSSSFHDSLRRSNKTDEKIFRTCSTSPIKTNDLDLKRSKSTKELPLKSIQTQRTKSTNKNSSTTSIIPLLNQCIQSEKTLNHSKTSLIPPKRPPPPPIPKKLLTTRTTTTVDNHIYDSFQESPSLTNNSRLRTIPKSHLPPMRVTEL